MIFHDIEQNTDAWFDLRAQKITSSKLGCIMAHYGKSFGKPAKDYALDIALERITGERKENSYTNAHMERGHEEEPLARAEYENQFFCSVSNGGFFEIDDFGCSPDGLVGSDGVIEIKSAIPSIHFARVERQSYDPAYKWQLIGNLMKTGREWIDFISYCSSYPEGNRIYVYRMVGVDFKEEFKMIDKRLDEFRELIEYSKDRILSGYYFLVETKT
jgi:hypothetical protein